MAECDTTATRSAGVVPWVLRCCHRPQLETSPALIVHIQYIKFQSQSSCTHDIPVGLSVLHVHVYAHVCGITSLQYVPQLRCVINDGSILNDAKLCRAISECLFPSMAIWRVVFTSVK